MFTAVIARELALTHNQTAFVQNEDGAGLELGGQAIGRISNSLLEHKDS